MSVILKRFKFVFWFGSVLCLCRFNLYAYELKTAGCIFQGADKDSIVIKSLAEDLISNARRFENFFGESLSYIPVLILIPENEDEYKRVTQHMLPEWSHGVALPGQRRIILRPANYYAPVRYREILLHELSHIYLAQIVPPSKVPLWFNEGLAMLMSGKTVSWEEGISIGNAIVSNNYIDFQDIDSLLSFGETKARLAYLQSFLAVRYMVATHGSEVVSALLRSLASGKSFVDAFTNTTGRDIIDFEYDFYQKLNDDYRWMSFLQFSNVFWILMVLLVITVFVVIKLRNRKKIDLWDSVEEE